MRLPFSRYRSLSPTLVSLSVLITLVLTLFEAGSHYILWLNWATAGLISFIVSNSITYLNLQSRSELRAYAVIWPFATAGLQFSYCHFPHQHAELFYVLVPMLLLQTLLITGFSLSLWQRRKAPTKCLLLGVIIGSLSAILPSALLLALLFPACCAIMRSWSLRNYFCVLTGTLFAIWVIYAGLFLCFSEDWADTFLSQYATVTHLADFSALFAGLGLWQYLFMGFTILLLFFYTLSGYFLNAAMSTRTAFSIKAISVVSTTCAILTVLDDDHFYTSFALFAMFLGILLTVHQAYLRSAAHEWSIVAIVGLYSLLCLLPVFV